MDPPLCSTLVPILISSSTSSNCFQIEEEFVVRKVTLYGLPIPPSHGTENERAFRRVIFHFPRSFFANAPRVNYLYADLALNQLRFGGKMVIGVTGIKYKKIRLTTIIVDFLSLLHFRPRLHSESKSYVEFTHEENGANVANPFKMVREPF